ncbi:MAG: SHOCT domain-containing protein [Gammaproteobacteria bacterium]|nr:SHOCT domain-containing protein [Gammaproteobacteria bacterium]
MNDFGMGFGMWIFWIISIVVVVFLAKMVIGISSGPSGTDSESPLEILQKRYASGEIDQQEFERIKKELDDR